MFLRMCNEHITDILAFRYGTKDQTRIQLRWDILQTVNGKIDLPLTNDRLKKEIDIFAQKGIKLFPFSAVTGKGVPEIIREMILLISREGEKGESMEIVED